MKNFYDLKENQKDIKSFIKLPKIALIADVENWAFHNYAKQIVKNLSEFYDFEIFFHDNYKDIELLMFEVKNFDLIHFFWRDALFSFLSPQVRDSFSKKGMDFNDFIYNTVVEANITTSIYDHLLLTESQIQERIILFNVLSIGYTTVSQRLFKLYSSFSAYPKPFEAVEDGVDLDFFKPRNLSRLSETEREIVIGWVGYSKWGGDGIDHKGLETIIKPAIAELQAEGYKIRGFYADRHERWIPHSEMNDYYNSIDIYVCASNIEGTPNPALESMACGLPVISTDVGIIAELFGTLQQNYILPTRSIEALKEKLRDLIDNPEKRQILSKESLEAIKKWTWKNQSQKWDIFFKKMLANSKDATFRQRRDYLRGQTLNAYLIKSVEENFELTIQKLETNLKEVEKLSKESIEQLELKISFIEQSKFWKLRNIWFKTKK